MAAGTGGLKLWIGLAISLAVSVVLLRTVEPDRFMEAFRQMEWWYLLPATAFTFASYFLRAVRWQLLLAPVKKCPIMSLYPVTIIGYMANNILPARLGELVRAFLLAEREGIPKGTSLASLVLDRILDGFSVLVIVLATMALLRLPPEMAAVGEAFRGGAAMIALFYLGVLVVLALLVFRRALAERIVAILVRPLPERFAASVQGGVSSFINGVLLPANLRGWLSLLASSAAIWLTALLPIHLVLRAFGLNLPFTASLFIMVFLVLAVMVPASPGYLGTYHAACTYALMAFSVEKEKALGMAVIIHGLNFLPVILVGFYYLWRLNLSFGRLRGVTEEGG
jgi:uncharacterized protein (TIRG00374 family)